MSGATDPRAVKTAPTVHALKSWPRFFEAIVDGTKTFEFRNANDRNFEVGDLLQLYEWEPGSVADGVGVAKLVPGATGREAFLEVLGVSIVAGEVRFDSGSSGGPSLTLAGRLAILSVRLVGAAAEAVARELAAGADLPGLDFCRAAGYVVGARVRLRGVSLGVGREGLVVSAALDEVGVKWDGNGGALTPDVYSLEATVALLEVVP